MASRAVGPGKVSDGGDRGLGLPPRPKGGHDLFASSPGSAQAQRQVQPQASKLAPMGRAPVAPSTDAEKPREIEVLAAAFRRLCEIGASEERQPKAITEYPDEAAWWTSTLALWHADAGDVDQQALRSIVANPCLARAAAFDTMFPAGSSAERALCDDADALRAIILVVSFRGARTGSFSARNQTIYEAPTATDLLRCLQRVLGGSPRSNEVLSHPVIRSILAQAPQLAAFVGRPHAPEPRTPVDLWRIAIPASTDVPAQPGPLAPAARVPLECTLEGLGLRSVLLLLDRCLADLRDARLAGARFQRSQQAAVAMRGWLDQNSGLLGRDVVPTAEAEAIGLTELLGQSISTWRQLMRNAVPQSGEAEPDWSALVDGARHLVELSGSLFPTPMSVIVRFFTRLESVLFTRLRADIFKRPELNGSTGQSEALLGNLAAVQAFSAQREAFLHSEDDDTRWLDLATRAAAFQRSWKSVAPPASLGLYLRMAQARAQGLTRAGP